jgi:anti-anti-sigma regulatory factor
MVQVSAVHGWDLEVDRGPDWLFVCPRPLTKDTTDRGLMADQVWALLEQSLTHRLVLELGDIGRLDDRLIEQLLQLQQRIHANEGIMRLCGLSAENVRLLQGHKLEGQITHYCSREAAVMGQERPSRPR